MDKYITISAADAALARLAISRYRAELCRNANQNSYERIHHANVADLEQFLERELHALKFGQ
jgi:hypothetical protein